MRKLAEQKRCWPNSTMSQHLFTSKLPNAKTGIYANMGCHWVSTPSTSVGSGARRPVLASFLYLSIQ